jgi:phosphate uptake regulator
VDSLYMGMSRGLIDHMAESPHLIAPATHLLLVAQYLERIGHQVANMARIVGAAIGASETEPGAGARG